jgi:hypothetical protein
MKIDPSHRRYCDPLVFWRCDTIVTKIPGAVILIAIALLCAAEN